MFDLFTPPARRVLFHARYEASRLNCAAISPEHLLLGFIAEDRTSGHPFLEPGVAEELYARFSVTGPLVESQPVSVDIPLDDEARAALIAVAELPNGSAVHPVDILRSLAADPANSIAQALAAKSVRL